MNKKVEYRGESMFLNYYGMISSNVEIRLHPFEKP